MCMEPIVKKWSGKTLGLVFGGSIGNFLIESTKIGVCMNHISFDTVYLTPQGDLLKYKHIL